MMKQCSIWIFLSFAVQIISSESEYRLPSTVKPIHYDLEFEFHFNTSIDSSFMNVLSHILINITDPQFTSIPSISSLFQIELNMGSNINMVDSDIYFPILNETMYLEEFDVNEETEIAIFNFTINEDLKEEIIDLRCNWIIAEIYFSFTSKLINGNLAGMYITSYQYNNTMIQNAVSSFGLTDARFAFPCFDEPVYKSTFDIIIIAPLNTTVLSNADILKSEAINNEICNYQYSWGESRKCKKVTFGRTPRMSTYVLTLFVGEFKSVSNVDTNNVVQSVWSAINDYQYAQFGLDVGLEILPYLEDLIGFNYGLTKMDNIAVSQFPWGAMESYGAIVYSKSGLLADIEIDDRSHLAWSAQLVAHEYAHMWFGDIVTCKWWDDTWLNEGFAQFYGYDISHIFYPQYNILSDWIELKNNIMIEDMSISVTSVVGTNIQSVVDILDMFGELQYTKAGAILQMIQYVMGNNTFNAAISDYVKTYQHHVVESNDLFVILNKYYNHSGDMIKSYVMQPGFPIIYIGVDELNNDNIQFKVEQKRFIKQGPMFYNEPYFDPDGVKQLFDEQNWWIHLSINTIGNIIKNEGFISNERINFINIDREISNNDDSEYYLFNDGFLNYHSTLYDDTLFKMILNSWKSLTYWDEMNIMIDRFNQIISNYAMTTSYLELIETITNSIYDDDKNTNYDEYVMYIKWNTIINSLNEIDDIICSSYYNDNNLINNYRNFSRQIIKPLYNDLNGYNLDNNYKGNNSEKIINLRNDVIVSLIRFKDEEILNIGYNIIINLDEIKLDENGYIDGIDKSILRSIIIASMAKLDIDIFNEIITIYSKSAGRLRSYIRESLSVLYEDINLLKESYDYIMRGYVEYNNNNITTDFGIAWYKINALNYLSTCNGIQYVWNQLIIDREYDVNQYNGTDFQFLLNTGYYSSGLTALTSLPNKFNTKSKFDQIYQYYLGDNSNKHKIQSTEKTANITLEDIATNIMWTINNRETLKQFLSQYGIVNETASISTTTTRRTTQDTADNGSSHRIITSIMVIIYSYFI